MATPTLANCIARRIGCYELVEEMKRKPGLAVYKAVDVRSGQLAVLKTMQGGQLAEREAHRLREAMGREAATLGRLRHPGIVRLLDRADDEAGNPYLVMEYVA
ncbi:MAG TPA: cyclic nucleotide-binding protein, partial [Terriglobia bacterium]|nr:cyclic nucleotide-binding protein [Terriglobia bacterium]